MSTKLVVKARQSTPAAHAANIFATFEVEIVDANGDVVAKLFNGTLRDNGKGYWITGPAKQSNGKWYKEWMLYPNLDQAGRSKVEAWIISEIAKQIPDPRQPRIAEPVATASAPVAAQAPTRAASTAPFGGGGGPISPPKPAQGVGGALSGPPNNPFAPKPFPGNQQSAGGSLMSPEERSNFPFGGSGFPN